MTGWAGHRPRGAAPSAPGAGAVGATSITALRPLRVALTLAGAVALAPLSQAAPGAACDKPVYLTLDTGHMGVADLMADVLRRQQVRVTFFAANEPTQRGPGSLSPEWAPWWKARASEGHEFATHTWDHVYWRADLPADSGGARRFRMRPSAGAAQGRESVWPAQAYCANLNQAARALAQVTGVPALPLFRAPGGKTSTSLLAAARDCGYAHVGWSPAGFLGDELPSESHPNATLLAKALRDVRSGDILMAHLGIWSRRDPWAPAVLEPLIEGLKAKGFCFATLSDHPQYRAWIASHAGGAR